MRRVLSGVLMPFKPLSLGLTGALLPPPGRSPTHDDPPPSRVLTTWQALPEDSTGSCAMWFLQGFAVPPCTETTTPGPSLTGYPSQRGKTFAPKWQKHENVVGLAGTTAFSLIVLGVMVFHRFARVITRVKYTRYEELVWLILHGRKFGGVQNCHYIRRGLKPRGRGRPLRTSILI